MSFIGQLNSMFKGKTTSDPREAISAVDAVDSPSTGT